jgi:CRP/FNR family cyclic AMP-dependent transcriptional regulator
MDATRLTALPVFDGLPEEELRRIATFAEETSASEGSTIVREGDFSDRVSVIEEGTVEVRQEGNLVASLGTGDVFGEVGVLGKTMRNADVVATSPVRLMTLTRMDLKRVPQAEARIRALGEQRGG